MTPGEGPISDIRTFPSLVKYLRDELGWPIESDDFEDITFDYTPVELGIDARTAAKIEDIKRLRPLAVGQPWGVFFVKFEKKRLPVVALRRILSGVALRKRASANKADQAAWATDDLLFISNYGEGEGRQISFAHFSEDPAKQGLPTLKVLGWNNLDTTLHLADVADTLAEHLRWPEDEHQIADWRTTWRGAFTLKPHEVITTSKELAVRLAELARAIRERITGALSIETDRGPLTGLMNGVREALAHDLDRDGFADMYAQTIAYGLLSARITDPLRNTADDFAVHMRTSPFLRELMEEFLRVGGPRGTEGAPGIDFDELGVSEVVDLLDGANMKAVVRDFGDRNPLEDPVIHFYELFLREYDAKQRMQRGVFYTPRPVVSFIVRSVDQLLRSEFGLVDGLADTTSWGELVTRREELTVPEGVSLEQDFVQVLDPATGTGTFLVEVIDLIHKTLVAKWEAEGQNAESIHALWNEYVPEHLLPRLHGFELLMAPYAIAHLKIGLKLYETGYEFGTDERARIFLTNALEPADERAGRLESVLPALAHEAIAVNDVKSNRRFTIVIGNPPYYGEAGRGGEWIASLLRGVDIQTDAVTENYFESDGQPLNERTTKWINDDYVKFLRLAEWSIETSGVGVVGFVTNHSYLDNPTFRGVRESLLATFPLVRVLDLHGNSNKKERSPDGASDENVFDIQQGVSIALLAREASSTEKAVLQADLWGQREAKYVSLVANQSNESWSRLAPHSPSYRLVPDQSDLRAEYERGSSVTDIFEIRGPGMTTARDHVVVDFEAEPLLWRAELFRDWDGTNADVCAQLGIPEKKGWDVSKARRLLQQETDLRRFIKPVLYRPLDNRLIFYHDALVWRTVKSVMRHMLAGPNVGIVTTRQTKDSWGATVTTNIIGHKACGAYDINTLFPLYVFEDPTLPRLMKAASAWSADVSGRRPNLSLSFVADLEGRISAKFGYPPSPGEFGPEDIFNYIYAVFYSASYRERYAEFLKAEFARVPLPRARNVFDALTLLGGQLASLHLLDRETGLKPPSHFGSQAVEVERVSWSDETVWIDVASARDRRTKTPGSAGFRSVPEDVWNFRVGGYQVCEKWLKDRKGRVLSEDEIAHYQRIVVALTETIRIMDEIDDVIRRHGGWPEAFT